MNFYYLRVILKIVTGQDLEDENGTDLSDLIADGWIYKTAVGYDVSSAALMKLEKVCQNWETI